MMQNKLFRTLFTDDEPLDRALIESLEDRSKILSENRLIPVREEPSAEENPVVIPKRHWINVATVVLTIFMCVTLVFLLIYACSDLPTFGSADPLTDDELSVYYVEEGLEHTGAPNIVTGIIMEFRGFDTLGESHVLYIAVAMVIMLLYTPDDKKWILKHQDPLLRHFEPTHDEVLRHGSKIIFPFIFVFAVNILLNGHLSPGGGFSGGAILGAGLMFVSEAFGPNQTKKYLNFRTLRRMMTCALAFYAISKAYVFSTGANGIENGLGTGVFGRIFSCGLLLPLNLAVGTVVACTMYVIYALLRRKGHL